MSAITFVVHVGEGFQQEYDRYFQSSPLFAGDHGFQIIIQRGFSTAGSAFNEAIEKSVNDVIVVSHLDVVFPAMWAQRFLGKLTELEASCSKVGVVGCIGMTPDGQPAGHVYRHDREFFPHTPLPAQVETLDGLLVCLRKSSGLRFDPALPSFFVHAIDLCLQASQAGLINFAVDAPCFHQGKNKQGLKPRESFTSLVSLVEKWKHTLPVRELSGPICGKPSYARHWLKKKLSHLLGYSPTPWWKDLPRIDPQEILYEGLPGAAGGKAACRTPRKVLRSQINGHRPDEIKR
ncbi:MAG: glycosyltransferase [Terriglobales bacterium]